MKLGVRENGPALAASVLLAAGVKLAYSRCGPDDLRWMTGPTQAIVGLLSGIDFTYETGYGYVNLAHRLVISKSCTGVNYLLAVFGLLDVHPRARGTEPAEEAAPGGSAGRVAPTASPWWSTRSASRSG